MIEAWPSQTIYPFGVHSSNSWKEIGAIFRLIDEFKADLFVELGVSFGGLTTFMLTRCYYSPEFIYRGIEVDKNAINGRVLEMSQNLHNAKIVIGSCFSKSVQEYINTMINKSKVAFIYCSGCDKPKKLKKYLELLRPGDVIVLQGFLLETGLREMKPFIENEKLERITKPYFTNTTIIAGARL